MTVSSLRMLPLLAVASCGTPSAERPQPPPSVVVSDAGAEPRQWLKSAPALHVPERVVIKRKTRSEVHFTNTVLEQGTRITDWPTVTAQVGLVASEGTGDVVITMTIEHVEVGDDVIAPWTREWAARDAERVAGLHVSWHVTPSGEISHFELEASKRPIRTGLLRELADAAAHTRSVFPDVPVGIGATWQVRERMKRGGVAWDATSTYRLRELSASSAVIDVTTAMTAPEQTLNAEPNASRKLTSGSATGTGQWRVPLHGLAAIGSVQTASETNLLIVDHRKRIQSTLKMDAFVDVKRIDEPTPTLAPTPASGEPTVAP